MKVEIWSDVVCPFCFIGKRKWEEGLNSFSAKENVEVVWRSFQLDPDTEPMPGKTQVEVLAEKKGWSIEQTRLLISQVAQMAASVGLRYNLENTVVANTFDAHRLIQLAAGHGLQDAAEEQLFKAYFEDGLDIGDKETLRHLGIAIGLKEHEVAELLASDSYAAAVRQDQLNAARLGINGVPYFVFNGKYGVSGAQSPEIFRQVLEKIWEEEQPPLEIAADATYCATDGLC